jgi:hypothetical protein
MPRPARQWTREQDEALRCLWCERRSVIEIAMLVRASPRAVHRRASVLGLAPRVPGPASPHPTEARDFVVMAAPALPISHAASLVGVGRSTAWRWVMASRWGRAA